MLLRRMIALATALSVNLGSVKAVDNEAINKFVKEASIGAEIVKNIVFASSEQEETYDIFKYTVSPSNRRVKKDDGSYEWIQCDCVTICSIDENFSGDLVFPDEINGIPVVYLSGRILYGDDHLLNIPIDRINSITLPNELYDLRQIPRGAEIKVKDNCEKYSIENDFVISKDYYLGPTILMPAKKLSGDIVYPEGIENHELTDEDFIDVKSVTIPDSFIALGRIPGDVLVKPYKDSKKYYTDGGFLIQKEYSMYSGSSHVAVIRACEELSGDVIIPEGVEMIARGFDGDISKITSVTLPDSLTTNEIGLYAIPASIEVKPKENSKNFFVNGDFLIQKCDTFQGVDAKEGNDSINVAVRSSKPMTGEVTIPEGVEVLGMGLVGNKDITVLNLPSTLRYFGMIDGMTSLKEINVADGNETYFSYNGALGKYARKSKYVWDDKKKDYEEEYYNRREIIALPEGYEGAFVVEDGEDLTFCCYAFSYLPKLTSVKLGKDTEFWGDHLSGFRGCTSLENIEVNGSIKGFLNINDTKFYKEQADGVLYSGKTVIGYKGIPEAGEKITIKEGTEVIADYAFRGLNISEVSVPASVERIGAYAFDNPMLEAVNIDPENKNYTSVDGVVFDKELKTLKLYPQAKKDESYIVPDGVEIIASDAFAGNSFIKHVEFPDSVNLVYTGAFTNCTALEEFIVPKNVTDMDERELIGCNLKVLDLSENIHSYSDHCHYMVYTYYQNTQRLDLGFGSGATYERIIFRDPNCNIANVKDTIIVGYKDSTAQAYAKENNLTFELLDEEVQTTTTTSTASTTSNTTTSTTTTKPTTTSTTSTTTTKPTTTSTTSTTTTSTTSTTTETTTTPSTTEPPIITTSVEIPVYSLGDVTGDSIIDGRDATDVLTDYAKSSTGQESKYNEDQKKAADVNNDNIIDGRDATNILTYYAKISVGEKITLEEFIDSLK